jgi:hypothetical protein
LSFWYDLLQEVGALQGVSNGWVVDAVEDRLGLAGYGIRYEHAEVPDGGTDSPSEVPLWVALRVNAVPRVEGVRELMNTGRKKPPSDVGLGV